jgi:2'-deoxynucleoside 5'-phosphate N-hydrolase
VKIYFAGAIRGGRDDWALYRQIIEVLGQHGTVLTEHIGQPELDVKGEELADEFIYERDLGWLKEADCLVAEVTTPSLGVGYEIGKATEWAKPVLCLYRKLEGRSLSAMIAGCEGVAIRNYSGQSDLADLIDEWFKASAIT